MARRPHPIGASTNPHDGPWTTCDRCGFISSHSRMQFQYDFMGGSVPQNLGLLVCSRCLDDLNWQQKLLILPPDPRPIANTRPEPYVVDETSWMTTQDGDVITAEDGETFITPIPNPNSTEGVADQAAVDFETEGGDIIITEDGVPFDYEPNP